MADESLLCPSFTMRTLADALKAATAPTASERPTLVSIGAEQMRAITVAVWRHAAAEGLDTLVPATPKVTYRTFAEAVSSFCDELARGLPGPRTVLFGVGSSQRAIVLAALDRDAKREAAAIARPYGAAHPAPASAAGTTDGER